MNMQTKSSAARQNVWGRTARPSSGRAGVLPLTSTRVERMLGWVSGTEGASRAQFLETDTVEVDDRTRGH